MKMPMKTVKAFLLDCIEHPVVKAKFASILEAKATNVSIAQTFMVSTALGNAGNVVRFNWDLLESSS